MSADSFTLLDFAPGAWLETCTQVPCEVCHDGSCMLCDDDGMTYGGGRPFAVWLDDDIIGSGESASEAVEDARRTVRGWESSS